MLANWITLARFPLLPLILAGLGAEHPALRLAGAGLLVAGLLLDTVDGMVARRRQETSLAGSVLDIAADRAYELVLYLWFAWSGLVPLAIPVIVVLRTTLTDAIRSVGTRQGTAPFDQPRGRLGRFLVASAWTRVGYGASKLLAFSALGVAQALGGSVVRPGTPAWSGLQGLAWLSVTWCVLRGAPVILEWLRASGTGLAPRR